MIDTPTQQAGPTTTRRRAGVTLLEMLVAIILVATLMAGVWSLSTIYTKMFESGNRRVTEAQLVRSLTEQFVQDIKSVVPVIPQDSARSRRSSSRPPAPSLDELDQSSGMASGGDVTFEFFSSSTLPHFGLIGTDRSLHLSVLQAVAAEPEPEADSEADLGSSSDEPTQALDTEGIADTEEIQPPVNAPELRIVSYTFQEPSVAGPGESGALAGLTRRETAWEQPATSSQPGPVGPVGPSPIVADNELGAESLVQEAEEVLPGEAPLGDETTNLVPEVVALQFRYFDGQNWTNAWDSLQSGSLPVAIEVTLQLMTADEIQTQYAVETGVDPNDPNSLNGLDSLGTDATAEELFATELTEPVTGRTYRCLVYLGNTSERNVPENVYGEEGSLGPDDDLEIFR